MIQKMVCLNFVILNMITVANPCFMQCQKILINNIIIIIMWLYWLLSRQDFVVMTRHYEKFSWLDGSFELCVKAASTWMKTATTMDKIQLHVDLQ